MVVRGEGDCLLDGQNRAVGCRRRRRNDENGSAQVKKFADAPVLNCCAVSIIVQVAREKGCTRAAKSVRVPEAKPTPD